MADIEQFNTFYHQLVQSSGEKQIHIQAKGILGGRTYWISLIQEGNPKKVCTIEKLNEEEFKKVVKKLCKSKIINLSTKEFLGNFKSETLLTQSIKKDFTTNLHHTPIAKSTAEAAEPATPLTQGDVSENGPDGEIDPSKNLAMNAWYGTVGETMAELLNQKVPRRFNLKAVQEKVNAIVDPIKKKEAQNALLSFQLKWLAYDFSIPGFAYLYNSPGDIPDVTLGDCMPWIATSLIADANLHYLTTDAAKSYIPPADQEAFKQMSLKAMDNATILMCTPQNLGSRADQILKDIRAGEAVSLSTGWSDHTVNVTICNDLLIVTNKGEEAKDGDVDQTVYEIGNLDDEALKNTIKRLLNNFNMIDPPLLRMKTRQVNFINNQMIADLGLRVVCKIPKTAQKASNCTYANNKAAIQSTAFTLAFQRAKIEQPNASEGEHIIVAQRYAQRVIKGVEMTDRERRLQEFIDLEPLVIKGEVDLKPAEFYRLLSILTGKFSQEVSEQKAKKIARAEPQPTPSNVIGASSNNPNPAQKYGRYRGGFYEGTGASEAAVGIFDKSSQAIRKSKLSVKDCAIVSTETRAKAVLANKVEGTFVLYRDSEDSSEIHLVYNTRDPDSQEMIQKNTKHEIIDNKKLGDLVTELTIRSEPLPLSLPCCLSLTILPDSKKFEKLVDTIEKWQEFLEKETTTTISSLTPEQRLEFNNLLTEFKEKMSTTSAGLKEMTQNNKLFYQEEYDAKLQLVKDLYCEYRSKLEGVSQSIPTLDQITENIETMKADKEAITVDINFYVRTFSARPFWRYNRSINELNASLWESPLEKCNSPEMESLENTIARLFTKIQTKQNEQPPDLQELIELKKVFNEFQNLYKNQISQIKEEVDFLADKAMFQDHQMNYIHRIDEVTKKVSSLMERLPESKKEEFEKVMVKFDEDMNLLRSNFSILNDESTPLKEISEEFKKFIEDISKLKATLEDYEKIIQNYEAEIPLV